MATLSRLLSREKDRTFALRALGEMANVEWPLIQPYFAALFRVLGTVLGTKHVGKVSEVLDSAYYCIEHLVKANPQVCVVLPCHPLLPLMHHL